MNYTSYEFKRLIYKRTGKNDEYYERFCCNYNEVIGNSCSPFKKNILNPLFCCCFPQIFPQMRLWIETLEKNSKINDKTPTNVYAYNF